MYAQEDITYLKNKSDLDTNYIKKLNDKFIVKVFLDNKVDSYSFFYKNNNENFTITPNIASKISVSLDYEIFSLTLSVPKKWSLYYVDPLKGQTKNISFSLGFFLKKWYQNFYFSDTKGYYVVNTENLILEGNQKNGSYLQLPGFRIRKVEGTTSYIVNSNKFSYRSFLYDTEIQKKSSGSFIPSLNYVYLYQSDGKIEEYYNFKGNIFSISGIAAYQYNWTISSKFYFSTGVSAGIGFRNSNKISIETDGQAKYHYTSFSSTLGYNINVKYRNKSFFCGAKGNVSENNAKDSVESSFTNSFFYGTVFLGYCFDPPRLISKKLSKIFF